MPTPPQLRSGVAQLSSLANNDLAALWRQVSTAAQAHAALGDILPALVDTYGAAAGTLAADWYDEARLKAGARGRFGASPADLPNLGRTESLAGWAAGTATDMDTMLTLIQGGMQRIIANASRDTIMSAAIGDPAALGWQRVTAGGCAFCEMLASRAELYSEASADFASHDNCNCSAVPAFGGDAKPVKAYTPSSRNITDADRARVRAYLRTH